MKEADLTAGLEAKGAKAASIPEAESEPPAEENLQTHWSLKLALFGIEKLLILLLALFDTFCLVFILTVCGLRIRANYRRKKLLREQMSDWLYVPWQAMQEFSMRTDQICIRKKYSVSTEKSAGSGSVQHSVHMRYQRKNEKYGDMYRPDESRTEKSKNWYENWIMKYIERLY